MAKKLQLQIPEPCQESWDKMTPVDKGRFCDSCQKAVVDFSGMSDTQLVAFFKKPSTGSVCGRFYNDQMDRNLIMPGKRMPWMKYLLQIIVPAFLFTSKAKSQGEVRLTSDTLLIDSKGSKGLKNNCGIKADTTNLKIKGRVINDRGEPLVGVSVRMEEAGLQKITFTDVNGNFTINRITDTTTSIALTFSSVGYLTRTVTDIKGENIDINIDLIMDPMITPGNVIIGAVVRIKRKKEPIKIFQRIFKDSSSKFFKAYPNPASIGSLLNFELKKAEAGEYQVDIINQTGQVLHSVTVVFETEKQINSLRVPMTAAGVYFIRMKNKKSGKAQTEKIIIQ